MILLCLFVFCIIGSDQVIGDRPYFAGYPQNADNLQCQGDCNATFTECPNPCPWTCQFPGGPGPCNRMCLKEGCECNDGYYLSEEGNCLQLEDCPGASKCTANETFAFCSAGCPNNFCPVDDSRGRIVCSQPFPCESGCSCKRGYLRLGSEDDRCLVAYECPEVPCTRPNEEWSSCPPPCYNDRCVNIGKSSECDDRFFSCRPQCICKPGFFRNDNDICVPEQECPPKCGYNEMPVQCKTVCPPQSCDISYTEYACDGNTACEPGCDCLPNYLRNASGICIRNEECPPPPRIPTCRIDQNEELSSCKIVCPPQSCASIYTLYSCVSDIPCEWGCNCRSGYLRNSINICVPSEECPTSPPPICGDNEKPSDCKVTCPPQTCESIFTTYNCSNNDVCQPGCDCLDNYLRNSNGICVPSEECFLEPQCNIPSECRSTCANPNPQNCPSVDIATDNQDGCKCKPGYILSDIDGVCILVQECPAYIGCNGDPNAIATSCPWPCPSTCDSPDAGTCGKQCEPVGCHCRPGFILSETNGTCILPDTCKYGNPCGVNGTFSDCAFRCPNQNCPEDDSGVVIACKPGRPCPSGCLCNEYYRRKSETDDTCVLASDCPIVTCTRPNEVWNPCPSECLAEACTDINQMTDCLSDPNNCQPKCVCSEGFYRNNSGYCVPEEEFQPPCQVQPECRPTCAVPNPPGCPFITSSETNEDDCYCQQGYILSETGGSCIKTEECPGGNPCGPNATFAHCRYNCPSFYCPTDDSRAVIICETFPFSPCYPGCICKLNHKILSREDPICIRSDECPAVNCTRPHEEWDPCPEECLSGYCEEVDNPPAPCNTLVLNCNPQCVCKKGYFRNPNTDICVSSNECRIINMENQPKH